MQFNDLAELILYYNEFILTSNSLMFGQSDCESRFSFSPKLSKRQVELSPINYLSAKKQKRNQSLSTSSSPQSQKYTVRTVQSNSEQIQIHYHNEAQAKYFSLILIQELVRLCNYDIYTYALMLEMLVGLSFQGSVKLTLKITITIFHISSKFMSFARPSLLELILWSKNQVTIEEVIECQSKILSGFNFKLPVHLGCSYQQVKELCFQYQNCIFKFQQK